MSIAGWRSSGSARGWTRPGGWPPKRCGGPSTEFVLGGGPGHDGDPAGTGEVAAISVNIGCVRMTERHLHADPPAREQVAAAISDIDAALDVAGAKIGVAQARSLLGLAG